MFFSYRHPQSRFFFSLPLFFVFFYFSLFHTPSSLWALNPPEILRLISPDEATHSLTHRDGVIEGRAEPGVLVRLFCDGQPLGVVSTNDEGTFRVSLTLPGLAGGQLLTAESDDGVSLRASSRSFRVPPVAPVPPLNQRYARYLGDGALLSLARIGLNASRFLSGHPRSAPTPFRLSLNPVRDLTSVPALVLTKPPPAGLSRSGSLSARPGLQRGARLQDRPDPPKHIRLPDVRGPPVACSLNPAWSAARETDRVFFAFLLDLASSDARSFSFTATPLLDRSQVIS